MTAALVIIAIIVGMALGAMAFVIFVLVRQNQRTTLLLVARSPLEAARAERISNGTLKPSIPEPGINPAELP